MTKADPITIRILHEQLHVLRAQAEKIQPEAADKPGRPGSGISVLIPQFNSLLKQARAALSDEPALLQTIAEVQPLEKIQERLASVHHKTARQQILLGADLLLQTIAQLIQRVVGTSPVTEKREFPFIADSQLRTIVERDYQEIQKAFIAECWKSVIILCGGTFEAILADLLQRDSAKAKAASKAPIQRGDLSRWDLKDLIDVSVELKLVSPGIEKLSHPVREYRNLVHASYEIRNRLTFGLEEARIALEILHMLHRDLSSSP